MFPDNVIFSQKSGAEIRALIDINKYGKIAVLVDENTRQTCYPRIQPSLPFHHLVEVPSGEENKNLTTCQLIWEKMTAHEFDRHSLLIIIGGGVLGDMGGFCAATYKRGIDFILVPTTLLSQVDASVGGKLGIDFKNLKNHIGVFQQPVSTIIDVGFLKTLPVEEIRSGYAEIIKHALINDASLWEELKVHSIEEQDWQSLVPKNVVLKSRITQADPTEKGLRKLLNFGHTIGHALESFLLDTNSKIMHGEAVAAGIIMESWISEKKGMLTRAAFEEIQQLIFSLYGKIKISDDQIDAISLLTLHDKKNKDNKILCVLLEEIGVGKIDCDVSLEDVKESLHYYRSN